MMGYNHSMFTSPVVKEQMPVAFNKYNELLAEQKNITTQLSGKIGQSDRDNKMKRLKQIERRLVTLSKSVNAFNSMLSVDGITSADTSNTTTPVTFNDVANNVTTGTITKQCITAPCGDQSATTSATATSVDKIGTVVKDQSIDIIDKAKKELNNKHFVIGVLTTAAILGTFHILTK